MKQATVQDVLKESEIKEAKKWIDISKKIQDLTVLELNYLFFALVTEKQMEQEICMASFVVLELTKRCISNNLSVFK